MNAVCIPLIVLAAGPAAAASATQSAAPAPTSVTIQVERDRAADYVIGPQDVLSIDVYDEPDLARPDVQVASDGTVDLPLVKKVEVSGLTASGVKAKLEALYEKDYLVNPQIFVAVKEFRSQSVQVLGAVKSPGVYRLDKPSAVLDVLSLAGGVSDQGGRNLLLLRAGDADDDAGGKVKGTVDPIIVDVHKLLVEGDTTQNLAVKGGDVVFVPLADEVYVEGEVKNPGALKFTPGMTLTQALTKMNGFTKSAAKRKVQVVRVATDGKKQTPIYVNVGKIEDGKATDIVLQPRDLIVVPESIF